MMKLRYVKARDNYLSNAHEAIQKNELRKASELLWGVITQEIKFHAALSNFFIENHGEFFDYVKKVSKEETDNENYYLMFVDLNTLHRNFYDEIIPEDTFPFFYERAMSFLRKTEELIKIKEKK
ncbi:MAG: hypothetical protein CVT89_05700 [Candidatus Altiarchaeales archaeon HGW-Altiarchaeales-2]|nr:MAG: hypothetical protein CVT89_05700 [Candidatus Altiarchaeales archaeon HGW-Altiarchaeales-2]